MDPNQQPPIQNNPTNQVFNSQNPQQPPIGNTSPASVETQKTVPTILVILFLLFLYPIGLLFMFIGTKWPKWAKILALSPLILGVVAIILSLILITAHPNNQFGNANNARRKSDMVSILNQIGAYAADKKSLPPALNALPKDVSTDISKTGADICADLVSTYTPALPQDPQTGTGTSIVDCSSNYDTGYYIKVDANNMVTVSAPHAENGEKIQDSRPMIAQATQTTTSTSETANWKTLNSSICKLSLKYPATWQVKPAEGSKYCLLTIVDPSRNKNQGFTLSIVSSTTWEYILSKYPGGQKTTVAGLDAYLPKPISDQTGVLNGIYLHQGTTIYNIVYYQSPTDSELNKTYQLIINALKFQ